MGGLYKFKTHQLKNGFSKERLIFWNGVSRVHHLTHSVLLYVGLYASIQCDSVPYYKYVSDSFNKVIICK